MITRFLKTKFNLGLLLAFLFLCGNHFVFAQITDESVDLSRKPTFIESFQYENAESSMNRLDYFLQELNAIPNSRGYFIVYGGISSKFGEVKAHLNQIPDYLRWKDINLNRFVYVHGGFREKLTVEFWLVPEGSCPPIPTPTVDPEKVKFKGKFTRTSLYNCC